MEPLNALSLAAVVVRFTNTGDELIPLARRFLRHEGNSSSEIFQLLRYLRDLKALSTFDVGSFVRFDDQETTVSAGRAEQVSITSTTQIKPLLFAIAQLSVEASRCS